MRKQFDLISKPLISRLFSVTQGLVFLIDKLGVLLFIDYQKGKNQFQFKNLFAYSLFLIMSVFSVQINAATSPIQEVFVYQNVAYYDVEEAKQAIKDYVESVQGVIPELLPQNSPNTNELLFQPYLDADEANPHVIVLPGSVNSVEESIQYLMDKNTVFGSPYCADSRLEVDSGGLSFAGWGGEGLFTTS